jgi:hypothetical protein
MLDSIKQLLVFIFGNNQKTRFRRIILVIIIICLTQCLTCGFDNQGTFNINWSPFIKINLNLKK